MEAMSSLIKQKYTNTNTSDSAVKYTNTNTSTLTLKEIWNIADKLESALGRQEQSRYELYCKVARRVPQHVIWASLEQVMSAKNIKTSRARYFSYLIAPYIK